MSTPNTPNLPQRKTVKQWREELGISQMEVARRTGASLAAIQGVESGRNEPRIGMALRIAEALGVTLDQVDWPLGNPAIRAKRRAATDTEGTEGED